MRQIINYIRDHDISLFALISFPLILALVTFINNSANQNLEESVLFWDRLQSLLAFFWILPLPVALVSLLGTVWYRRGVHLRNQLKSKSLDSKIYFRLVTKGTNQQTVKRTVENVINTMLEFNLKHHTDVDFLVEVVTEKTEVPIKDIFDLLSLILYTKIIELPKEYNTKNNSKYKARALHFAIENSTALAQDWIFHLDDESQIDEDTVLGILDFIGSEEEKMKSNPGYKPLIGQGTIVYYRSALDSAIYTLADSVRTADDIGRFYFQNVLKMCIFGMHGSFILCRNSVEMEEGFDFVPSMCITEDAYWGIKAMQRGYRFGHVFGFVHEQSPSKGGDFIKQRKRWFVGLMKVILSPDLSLKYKLILSISMIFWAFSGLVVFYTALNIIHPVMIPQFLGFLASFTFSIYILMYLIGFYVNFKFVAIPIYRKILFFFAQLIFIPFFSILESLGAIYGLMDRKLDFYVIKK